MMKKNIIIAIILLSFFIPFAFLFSLEYLSIWNEWSLFIPNDEKMRSWVDKSEIVKAFKEKYPNATEQIMPYSGTRHYNLGSENVHLSVDLNNDGDIKYIHLSCVKSEPFICASSATNYIFCPEPLSEKQLSKIMSFLESNSCPTEFSDEVKKEVITMKRNI